MAVELGSLIVPVVSSLPGSPTTGQVVSHNGTFKQYNGSGWDALTLLAQTSGGATPYTYLSLASNNLNFVKASPGQIYSIQVFNNSATLAAYLKIYDKTSAPVVASDTPKKVIMVPAGGGVVLESPAGIAFGTGIAFGIVGGAGNTDATNTAANQIVLNIDYA